LIQINALFGYLYYIFSSNIIEDNFLCPFGCGCFKNIDSPGKNWINEMAYTGMDLENLALFTRAIINFPGPRNNNNISSRGSRLGRFQLEFGID
tara:strand:+ start:102 stop:383 length:282 start_codon:yes stop_codon:yes gene_type:complete